MCTGAAASFERSYIRMNCVHTAASKTCARGGSAVHGGSAGQVGTRDTASTTERRWALEIEALTMCISTTEEQDRQGGYMPETDYWSWEAAFFNKYSSYNFEYGDNMFQ